MSLWGWHGRALIVLRELSQVQPYISSDDLYDAMENDPPPHFNAIGSAFSDAAKLGIIRDSGTMTHTKRASGKGRKITLWQSPLFSGPIPQERRDSQTVLF